MRTSARWRRAVHDAQPWRRWTRVTAASGVLAVAVAFVSWSLGVLTMPVMGGLPAGAAAAVASALLALLGAPLVALGWHYWRAPSRLVEDLERRVAALEQAGSRRDSAPSPRVRFEYRSGTHEALLHVTNDGHDGEFWAPMSVDGSLSARLDRPVCATWQHADGPRTSMATGETRTLRLAQLDLSAFPFARWEVYGAGEGGSPALAVPAMHTSVIGGDPGASAPIIFLEIALLSAPPPLDGVRTCTIALHPFEAQRLRP
jgi:hypothetical protein